ncbi:MAG: hypothetical protein COA50_09610 [Flavobacteriaceae bacterium]|nr:MAG: hypothetical protein COA50_09610 [Flavobacteriaceae bacterium]
MKKSINGYRNSSIAFQIIASIIAFLLYRLSSVFLEKSYASSKFPVSYFEAQTSFDALKLKSWYQFLIDNDTFRIYINTQFIDFIFIFTVILMGFSIWTLLANLHKKDSFFNKKGYIMAFSLPFAAFFDVLENLISFYMLSEPKEFINEIVYIYSSFATIKFGFWGIALLWLLVSIVALIFNRLRQLVTPIDAHKV